MALPTVGLLTVFDLNANELTCYFQAY